MEKSICATIQSGGGKPRMSIPFTVNRAVTYTTVKPQLFGPLCAGSHQYNRSTIALCSPAVDILNNAHYIVNDAHQNCNEYH